MNDSGMFWAALGMAWVFGCAAVLIVTWHLRGKRRLERMTLIHQERMRAIEKGITLPDLDQEANLEPFSSKLNPRWPLGLGALIVMASFGFIVAFVATDHPDLQKLWSMGLMGIFVGLGLVLYYFLTRTGQRQ